jgi:maltose alpha-D-glucosyltransferase/alpha-amylase
LPAEVVNALPMPPASISNFTTGELPKQVEELIGTYIDSARQLGERTAHLHLALSSESEDHAFAPEPFTPHGQRGLFQSMRNLLRRNFQLLSRQLDSLPPEVQSLARQVLASEAAITKRLRAIYTTRLNAIRIRHHGDYHLGNVLYTGKEFLISDFEGEPGLPLSERRLKHSPLHDVAGMIRSFEYAARVALEKQVKRGALQPDQLKTAEVWARFWFKWVSSIFYHSYLQTAGSAAFLPASQSDLQILLDTSLLRKVIYEIGCELNSRPDWIKIPLEGILELTNQEPAA